MDCVWIVLDSLSYGATPFADDGPQTLPCVSQLAEEHGTIFTSAYAPGPFSPSSHASFFTGKLPSQAGMNEAHPFYDGSFPTIADALSGTHRTELVSTNPFLFNGLNTGFDEQDKMISEPFWIFKSGTNPRTFSAKTHFNSRRERYLEFLLAEGAPVRSLVNGIGYKLWRTLDRSIVPKGGNVDGSNYQNANYINEKIVSAIDRPGDVFVVANYMDAHPPFHASVDSLEKFAPDEEPDQLPVENSGRNENSFDEEKMYKLYLAAVRDLDRRLGPFLESLVDDGVTVILTSDHGPWFATEPLSERRLHVPLMVLSEERDCRTVDHTVSLRALPHTTEKLLRGSSEMFDGYDLMNVTDDRTVVSEHLHRADSDQGPFTAKDDRQEQSIQHDFVIRKGSDHVTFEDGFWSEEASEAAARELRDIAEPLLDGSSVRLSDVGTPDQMQQRLKDLGYL